jgi:hypothetical protein
MSALCHACAVALLNAAFISGSAVKRKRRAELPSARLFVQTFGG